MKNVTIPPIVMYGVSALVLIIAAVAVWLTIFRQPAPTDPRNIKPQDILDPDPPRTRDMAPGRGGS